MKLLTFAIAVTALAADGPELTPAIKLAVESTKEWASTAVQPISTADGRVLFPYGPGMPTVVCAPLKLCVIELQPGEKLSGEVQSGDRVRWSITPVVYGSGAEATTGLVIKPLAQPLDTSLVVPTDRRVYYIRLLAQEQGYMARVGFQHSDEDARKWVLFAAAQKQQEKERQVQADILPAMITAETMNFNYTVTAEKPVHFRPVRVYDDGSKTYITMPPELRHRTAPALEILGADGKSEMTNYRVKSDTYIVDRLFDRAQLVSGAGKKAEKVSIARVAQAE